MEDGEWYFTGWVVARGYCSRHSMWSLGDFLLIKTHFCTPVAKLRGKLCWPFSENATNYRYWFATPIQPPAKMHQGTSQRRFQKISNLHNIPLVPKVISQTSQSRFDTDSPLKLDTRLKLRLDLSIRDQVQFQMLITSIPNQTHISEAQDFVTCTFVYTHDSDSQPTDSKLNKVSHFRDSKLESKTFLTHTCTC